MATLAVLKFDTPGGASDLLATLAELQNQRLITILDAAVVTWPAEKKKPQTRQLVNLTAAGALNGTFWGMLFGFIFMVPFLGAAFGAAMGALMGHFSDYGIDDEFIKELRAKVTPGTSGLFILEESQAIDKVADVVKAKGIKFDVIQTNLSKDQEQKLKETFGEG
jgi:uncharacterized membrane protein